MNTDHTERRNRHAEEYHHLLPQAKDAEEGVLGSMLMGGAEIIEDILAQLTEEHFHFPANGTIFGAIREQHTARKPTDFICLTTALRDMGKLDECGGPAAIAQLQTLLPSAGNFRHYVQIVREKHIRRKIIKLCTGFTARGYGDEDSTETLLEEFQGEAIDIGNLTADAEALRRVSKDEIREAVERIQARYHQRGKCSGLSTGFVDLDRMLDGLKKKYVYVFAGRPAMGKSAVGINFAENISLGDRLGVDIAASAAAETLEAYQQAAVAIFAVEMTRDQIIDRMMCGRAGVNVQRLRDGFLGEQDFPNIARAAQAMANGRLYLDDTAGLTIAQFRARARRAVIRNKCKLIVIDYVQIMKGSSKRARDNRNLELGEIMQGIRETAKQLDVPIIVLAQLNRGAEERKESRPTMADLKECGAIEEEAHVVALLYRPVYYAKSDEARQKLLAKYMDDPNSGITTMSQLENYAEIIVDKQRDGPVGTVKLNFRGELTRFENRTGKLYSNNPDERQQ